MERHVTLDDAHYFLAGRVHLPAGPAFLEPEQADEASVMAVIAVALLISLVPLEAGELRLGDGSRAAAEVDGIIEQRLARLHSPAMTKAFSLLPSGSRK